MPSVLNLDVMLAKRKMRSRDLAPLVGIPEQNISLLKSGQAAPRSAAPSLGAKPLAAGAGQHHAGIGRHLAVPAKNHQPTQQHEPASYGIDSALGEPAMIGTCFLHEHWRCGGNQKADDQRRCHEIEQVV